MFGSWVIQSWWVGGEGEKEWRGLSILNRVVYTLHSGQLAEPATRKVKLKVTQWCPTLCNPMDYTIHGILQARILEWVAFPFSRGSFHSAFVEGWGNSMDDGFVEICLSH